MTAVAEQPVLERPITATRGFGVVCCVESGLLEPMTVLMAASLRRYGGVLADAPILAVTPRLGPPLARSTRQAFDRLGVEWINVRRENRYGWQHYMNKLRAVVAAEERLKSEAVVWLDSDVLVLGEPTELCLRVEDDFAACAPDDGVLGSTGPGDPHDGFWQRATKALGIDLESLPYLTTCLDGQRIRFYWNSGVFSYRRGTSFARDYMANCERYLAAQVATRHPEVHFMDQVTLGLTAHARRMRWRPLPHMYNYAWHSKLQHQFDPRVLPEVRILHYHDMFREPHWNKAISTLRVWLPEVAAWLEEHGPVCDPGDAPRRAFREALRVLRGFARRRYYARSGFQK